MSNFLTLVASLLVIIGIPVQMSLDTYNTTRNNAIDRVVYTYVQKARLNGGFTAQDIEDMRDSLEENVDKFDASDPDEFIALVDTTRIKYRKQDFNANDLISYEFRIKIKNKFIGGILFGDLDEETYYHVLQGNLASEKIDESNVWLGVS